MSNLLDKTFLINLALYLSPFGGEKDWDSSVMMNKNGREIK